MMHAPRDVRTAFELLPKSTRACTLGPDDTAHSCRGDLNSGESCRALDMCTVWKLSLRVPAAACRRRQGRIQTLARTSRLGQNLWTFSVECARAVHPTGARSDAARQAQSSWVLSSRCAQRLIHRLSCTAAGACTSMRTRRGRQAWRWTATSCTSPAAHSRYASCCFAWPIVFQRHPKKIRRATR